MIPDFAGKVIEIVRLDWSLQMWTEDNWAFVLSQPVLVTTADRAGIHQVEVAVDVEPGPTPDPLVGVEGATIQRLQVSREGHLGIQLSDRHLTVAPSPHYQAWEIVGHRGERLTCWVGGRLEYYAPLRRDEPDS